MTAQRLIVTGARVCTAAVAMTVMLGLAGCSLLMSKPVSPPAFYTLDGGDVTIFDGQFDHGALLGIATLHRRDQRQSGLAFAQVVTQIFAHHSGVAGVIEHVIDHLERGTQRLPVERAGGFDLGGGASQDGADAGAGLKQLGCFGADHLQVTFFIEFGVVHIHEL